MYEEKISAYFDAPERREELLAAISRLVAVKSVKGEPAPNAPFGPGPAAALAEGIALAGEWGFTTQNHDNYVGTADMNDMETRLHVLAHLDVVGEGTGWSTDPYTCTEKDGMIYGRGVSDDKGPLVCALMAMRAIRDLGLPLTSNVRMVMGSDEESGSEDIAYYYARNPFAPYTFTPDADFPVINIEKGHYHPSFGRTWSAETALPRVSELTGGFRTNVVPPESACLILGLDKAAVEAAAAEVSAFTATPFTITEAEGGVRIHCAGKNAHAASPEEGINSISAILELLDRLPLADCESTRALKAMHTLFPFGDLSGKALGIAKEDEESGALTLNLAIISLNAEGFTAKFDARFPISSTEENCKLACEKALAAYGISVTADPGMTAVHCVPADSKLVSTLLSCYERYTGVKDAKPLAIGGGTYVHDIPGGVAFGCQFPGFNPKMHSPDEQADVDQLLCSCKIFTQAIYELCR